MEKFAKVILIPKKKKMNRVIMPKLSVLPIIVWLKWSDFAEYYPYSSLKSAGFTLQRDFA